MKILRVFGITVAAASALILAETAGVSVIGVREAKAQNGQPQTLQELLDQVRKGRVRENAEMRQREERFRKELANRQRMLRDAEAEERRQQALSEQLEATARDNEEKLRQLEAALAKALGSAGELFGTVRQVAADTRAHLKRSLVSAQHPNRGDRLEVLTRGRVLPTLEQMTTLWSTLFEEMIAQSETVYFSADYVETDGTVNQSQQVVRIGPFSAMVRSDGEFLKYNDDIDSLQALAKQPGARFLSAARTFVRAQPGELVSGAVDPSQGSILDLLVKTPGLYERIGQGKTIGYITLVLGAIGAVIAIYRLIALTFVSMRVGAQLRSPNRPGTGNPLGRMLKVYEEQKSKGVDESTLELRLDEQFLKEKPRLEWGLGIVRVLAAVAPLLGLLGTVTGMIIVFQQITLFGTGDPKLMAGGISQALVTTVIGLCVAIPLLLLHSLAQGRAKNVEQVLEEQSAGLVARRAEERHR